MKLERKIPLFIVIFAIIFQNILFQYFPYPELNIIVTAPITIILIIILSSISYFVFKKIKKKSFKIITSITLLIVTIFISLLLYPKEKPIEQIGIAIKAIINPESIKYEYLFREKSKANNVLRVVSLAKYKDSIPETVTNVSYYNRNGKEYTFYLAKFHNQIKTDNSKIHIKQKSKNEFIFEDIFCNEKIKFKSPNDVFGKKSSWGKSLSKNSEVSIYFNEIELYPDTKFHKLVYKIVSILN